MKMERNEEVKETDDRRWKRMRKHDQKKERGRKETAEAGMEAKV